MIAGGGGTHIERLVRPLMVELCAEVGELLLLGAQGGTGRVVSAFRVRCRRSWRPFWCGLPGSMHSGRRPRRTHQAESCERRPRVWVANGAPLSGRIRRGRPNPLNTRVNTGVAAATLVDDRAWQLSSKRL